MRIVKPHLVRRLADRLGLKRPLVVHVGKDGQALPPPRKLAHFHEDRLEPGRTRWAWPRHLDAGSTAWLSVLRELYGHPLSFPWSLSPQAGLLLHALVLNHRPRACVETGSNIGISSLWIAGALEELGAGTLACFDDLQPMRMEGVPRLEPGEREAMLRGAIERAGVAGRVRLYPGDSAAEIRAHADEVRASAGGSAGGVQLAFLDGDHTFDGVLRDFLAVEPMLDTGGIVVLHDTFPFVCGWDGPRRLMNELGRYAAGTYQTLDLYLSPVNYGMAVLRRVG